MSQLQTIEAMWRSKLGGMSVLGASWCGIWGAGP